MLNFISLERRRYDGYKKVYSNKTLKDLEKEYEHLNIFDLVNMNFTLEAHQTAVKKLIKKNRSK